MNIKSIVSKQFSLEARDWLKSLFYAVIVPVLLQVQSVLHQGDLNLNWVLLGQVALSAVVAHLLRKFTEPSKLINVQKIDNEKVPVAEYFANQANQAQDTPPVIAEVVAQGNPSTDPPPNQDPTHPPKKPIDNIP